MTQRAHVALFGDWNAQLHDTGRYSPAWIGRQIGLRVVHAGRGRHGNIDYGLTNVGVKDARRVGNGARSRNEGGSDHDAILFTLDWPANDGPPVKVLLWNMERDRQPALVVAQLKALVNVHDPDVILLNEANDYLKRIEAALPRWTCVTGHMRGTNQNAILIRGDRPGRVAQLSEDGWITVSGHEHAPIYGVFVKLDGTLHLGCVHFPPTVNWLNGGSGMPYGPPLRVAVYVTAARKLVRIVRRWDAKAQS
jgi:hypothetical protein